MVTIKAINNFISNKNIAVIGTSTNKKKFGYIVFKKLKNNNYNVFPVNPGLTEIEGVKCYPDVQSLPPEVTAVVFITQPEITAKIVVQLREIKNIAYLWFQPGSVNKETAVAEKDFGKNIIDGECILMYIEPTVFPHSLHGFFKKVFRKYPK